MNGDEPIDGEIEVNEAEVVVHEWQLLRVSAIDVQPGGLSTGDSVAHARIMDIPHSKLYLVPMNRASLNAFIGQATYLLEEISRAENAAHEG